MFPPGGPEDRTSTRSIVWARIEFDSGNESLFQGGVPHPRPESIFLSTSAVRASRAQLRVSSGVPIADPEWAQSPPTTRAPAGNCMDPKVKRFAVQIK